MHNNSRKFHFVSTGGSGHRQQVSGDGEQEYRSAGRTGHFQGDSYVENIFQGLHGVTLHTPQPSKLQIPCHGRCLAIHQIVPFRAPPYSDYGTER
jgi:hypothetical protein